MTDWHPPSLRMPIAPANTCASLPTFLLSLSCMHAQPFCNHFCSPATKELASKEGIPFENVVFFHQECFSRSGQSARLTTGLSSKCGNVEGEVKVSVNCNTGRSIHAVEERRKVKGIKH